MTLGHEINGCTNIVLLLSGLRPAKLHPRFMEINQTRMKVYALSLGCQMRYAKLTYKALGIPYPKLLVSD